jgi:hypothetical protein
MDSLQVFKDHDEGMLLVMQAAALAHSFPADACRLMPCSSAFQSQEEGLADRGSPAPGTPLKHTVRWNATCNAKQQSTKRWSGIPGVGGMERQRQRSMVKESN